MQAARCREREQEHAGVKGRQTDRHAHRHTDTENSNRIKQAYRLTEIQTHQQKRTVRYSKKAQCILTHLTAISNLFPIDPFWVPGVLTAGCVPPG